MLVNSRMCPQVDNGSPCVLNEAIWCLDCWFLVVTVLVFIIVVLSSVHGFNANCFLKFNNIKDWLKQSLESDLNPEIIHFTHSSPTYTHVQGLPPSCGRIALLILVLGYKYCLWHLPLCTDGLMDCCGRMLCTFKDIILLLRLLCLLLLWTTSFGLLAGSELLL